MDYLEAGEKAKKLHSPKNPIEFIKLCNDSLKDTHYIQKAEFVRGLLRNSKNEALYEYASGIANNTENCEFIWSVIFNEFNKLIKGKNKPPWSYKFMYKNISLNDKIRFNNYDIGILVYAVLNYDGGGSGHWFTALSEKPWFSDMEFFFKKELVKQAKSISPDKSWAIFRTLKDLHFYYSLVDANYSPELFRMMLSAIKTFPSEILFFNGGETIDDIMKKYETVLSTDKQAMDTLASLIRNYYTTETGILFCNLIELGKFAEEDYTPWLKRIVDIQSPIVSKLLYKITKDNRYLPEKIKNLFF
jgi:hypothetical protein